MLPGKKLTPEDAVQILRRRFWLMVVPMALASSGTAIVARTLPDQYRAETTILVIPQRVPENYVRPTVAGGIEDRLQTIAQQILSRTRLERTILDFDLYPQPRRAGVVMENIVELMRKHVGVQVLSGNSFSVSFIGDDPRTVMLVTQRLASLFIEENLRDREVMSVGTNQFLESQLDDARRRLIEHERKLEQYRRRHAGELPSQLESNLQVLHNLQLQIQVQVDSLSRDRDRRLVLERQLGDLEREPLVVETPVAPALPADPDGPLAGASATEQLAAATAQLQALTTRFTASHPDVRRLQRRIRELEPLARAETQTRRSDRSPRALTPDELARDQRKRELRAEIAQLDKQIQAGERHEHELRQAVADYQRRVEMIPTRESEMTELMRDYSTLQAVYASLMEKNEEAKLATNLERRQVGQQFKLLDPARLPEKPFSPNRRRMTLLGLAAGLALGLAIIALLEYLDRTFKTDDDVARLLGVPVLAVVPLMRSDRERRRARWRAVLLYGGLGTTVAACFAVVIYTFVR
jgi:polysaccharide chain length determinant protein (PEP-CTERM system associated)